MWGKKVNKGSSSQKLCHVYHRGERHHLQTAHSQVQKAQWLPFATISPEDNTQRKKEKGWVSLTPFNFYEVPVSSCTHTHSHTLRLLALSFAQLLCCHHYLDSVGLQKPPEAHFVQGSCVRHPTVPNNGVSQSKNLSFVAGVCQGFGVSRWRSNRRKST